MALLLWLQYAIQSSPYATLLVLEGYGLTLNSTDPYDACLLTRSSVRSDWPVWPASPV